MKTCVLSHFQLCVILWTVQFKVLLSLRFPREAYWSGFPFSSPGDLTLTTHIAGRSSEPPGKTISRLNLLNNRKALLMYVDPGSDMSRVFPWQQEIWFGPEIQYKRQSK